jgi:hypothetical protein
MKKFLLALVLCLSLVAALVLVPSKAVAKPPGEYVEGTMWICILDYDPSHTNIWETKNTSHGRNGYQWSFGGREEGGYGPMLSTVNWNLNLKNDEGVTWGTNQHDIFDEAGNWKGAWIGTYTGKLSLADPPAMDIFGNPIYLVVGKAVAYGTGAFAGMQQRVNFWQEAYDPDEENPCNAVFNPDENFPFELPMTPVIMHVEGYEFMGD